MKKIKITTTIFRKLFNEKFNDARIIESQTTKEYELKCPYDDNSIKADTIFHILNKHRIDCDGFDEEDNYDFVYVDSISMSHGLLYPDKRYYTKDRGEELYDRVGYEIFNTHIDSVVMLELHTQDRKIIRLDFEGNIDTSMEGYYKYFTCDIKDECRYPTENELVLNKIEQILKENEIHYHIKLNENSKELYIKY